MANSSSSRVDRDTFLENLRASGLVEGPALDAALATLSDVSRGKVLARELVEKGIITRFQAELLLAGRTHGFHLGQYRILEEIGRGGMGRVFKAEHMTMSRPVALKILSPALTKTEKARLLFQREVKAAAKLNHPNIVTAFDANQLDDRCYLVMEFVDGPNLSDFVRNRGPLPYGQACDFIRQAALGLQYAHDLGMVHRDIKPANLLVTKNTGKAAQGTYTVKILDFGLARVSAQDDGAQGGKETILTGKQTVMGTPDYLAPEQARSIHDVDNRSDLYSLGCSFYYLLTGHVPFPGGTAFEKLVRHTTETPKPVKELKPDVPAYVSEIIERLLEKEPIRRFQSGTELAGVLALVDEQGRSVWVDVEPIAGDLSISPSSLLLPRQKEQAPEAVSDLWASLEAETSSGNTLGGEQSKTTVSGLNVPVRKNNAFVPWLLGATVVVILVVVGLLIRMMIKKFGAV